MCRVTEDNEKTVFYNYKKRAALLAMAAICGFMLFVSLDEAYGAQPESDVPPQELVEDANLYRAEFSSTNGCIGYCEFLENADVEGKTSLVLVMHGMSNCGNDNLKQLASPAVKPLIDFLRLRKIKALVLVPQCPSATGWVRTSDPPVLNIVHDLVTVKRRRYRIDSQHSIITGFSMGGGGCYFYMMQHSGVFGKAIVVGAGGQVSWASKLHGEFYIAVGTEDQYSSVDAAETLAAAISRNNYVRFEKLEGVDHIESATIDYSGDCWEWAFGLNATEMGTRIIIR